MEQHDSPSFSRTVAYREFARGHDCRLQNPVTLYSFRQKFCVVVLFTSQLLKTSVVVSSFDSLDFIRAKRLVDDGPDHVVALHPR